MSNSILLFVIFMFVVLAVAGAVFFLLSRKKVKTPAEKPTPAPEPVRASDEDMLESYADAGGHYALQNASVGASCGCSARLSSDLSNCCAQRYPIDLPFPESGVLPPCSDCAATMKYVLQ